MFAAVLIPAKLQSFFKNTATKAGKIHAFIRLYSVQATKLYQLSDKPRNKSKFYALIF